MEGRVLDYVALGILIFVVITLIYGIIYIHDIPYEMAKKRNHPHQDAIHTAGWISLFLMHTIWPFLWIWATLYKPGYGWGFTDTSRSGGTNLPEAPKEDLNVRISNLEHEQISQQERYAKTVSELTKRIVQLEKQVGKEVEK